MKPLFVMKRLLILFILFSAYHSQANDTLTRAQVYNFNVGDTFDYEIRHVEFCSFISSNVSVKFTRCVINNIYSSSNGDTLFIIRQWIFPPPLTYDTLLIDSLQDFAIYVYCHSCFSNQYNIDTTTHYNSVSGMIGGSNFSKSYAAGLGAVLSVSTFWNSSIDGVTDSSYLIYYSKGGITSGTPYNIANYSNLIHYTPIPEECAEWISTSCSARDQRTRTGSRIAYNGHTYVQLLYSADNYNGPPTIDSLVGYFSNDTLNQKANLYQALDTMPIVIYDFSAPAGGPVLSLTKIITGGGLRTFWRDGINSSSPGYIEGIGGTEGFWPTEFCIYQDNNCSVRVFGTLRCFSVCGHAIYPDSSANCSFPLDIKELSDDLRLHIYPNPANDYCTLQLDAMVGLCKAGFIDLTGREVMAFKITNPVTQIPIANLPAGLYFIKMSDAKGHVGVAKLVKE